MMEELIQLVKENPNDMTLGSKVRALKKKVISVEIDGVPIHIKVQKEYPNDISLGKAIRMLVISNIS